MSDPIIKLTTDIADLEKERDDMYVRFSEIKTLLENYKTLLNAFQLVSSDPDLYDRWVATAENTPRPKPTPPPAEEPPVSNP